MPTTKLTKTNAFPRPPVVAVMGHVDHGKSTLLDYIRKTDIAAGEAGGITQKIGAYEAVHTKANGDKKSVTFLDTPGHEAFAEIRERGANIADIAILVVSAEDGVMPQTLDAYSCIKKAKLPVIVAINKIDKPNADIERTKGSLAENEIYLEGYGGDIPWAATSAKSGAGINELLELIDLVSEMNEISGKIGDKASGFTVETERDPRRGIAATVVIKNGTLKQGDAIVSGAAFAVIKMMEDDKSRTIKEAPMGTPARVIGWSNLPKAGLPFIVVSNKKEAELAAEKNQEMESESALIRPKSPGEQTETAGNKITIPAIIKADNDGSINAIVHELKKIETEKVKIKLISRGIGDISETDAKIAESATGAVIIGFNVKIDNRAAALIERGTIETKLFDVIYKLSEWLAELAAIRTPKIKTEEKQGAANILKLFGKERDRQIIGGKVTDGKISLGDDIKIIRRESEIGQGKVKELQRQKVKVDEVVSGTEFGVLIESKITLAAGDIIEPFRIIEK